MNEKKLWENYISKKTAKNRDKLILQYYTVAEEMCKGIARKYSFRIDDEEAHDVAVDKLFYCIENSYLNKNTNAHYFYACLGRQIKFGICDIIRKKISRKTKLERYSKQMSLEQRVHEDQELDAQIDVRILMETLNRREKIIFYLSSINWSHREIGKLLDVPEATMYSHLRKIKKKIKKSRLIKSYKVR